ncbi:MAG: hypothetical protein E6I87_13165 [Chloroflexi bacterium]|nr:MAG: hypothetical protein E6I87_13165 [Chloroflexota bacterium]
MTGTRALRKRVVIWNVESESPPGVSIWNSTAAARLAEGDETVDVLRGDRIDDPVDAAYQHHAFLGLRRPTEGDARKDHRQPDQLSHAS